MQDSIKYHLNLYFQDKSVENFLQLRESVVTSPNYSPYQHYNEDVSFLLDQEKFEQAKDYLMLVMDNWLLNPSIHWLLSFVFDKMRRIDEANTEWGIGMLFLEGILSTGDGSKERPYLVSSTLDEYDVLRHLNKKSVEQGFFKKDGKDYDRQVCEDGTQIYFDVTTPYRHLQRQFDVETKK